MKQSNLLDIRYKYFSLFTATWIFVSHHASYSTIKYRGKREHEKISCHAGNSFDMRNVLIMCVLD